MFAQLRRVVYLLVLLQCCACVAYAESAEEGTISAEYAVKIDELITNLKNDSDTDAEDLLANMRIDLYSLREGVSLCNNNSELAKSVVGHVKNIIEIVDQKKGEGQNDFSSWNSEEQSSFEDVVKSAKEVINKTRDAVEKTKRAQYYCTQWSAFLKEVYEQVGEPTESDVKEIKGSSGSDSTWMIISTYGELLALKGELHLATRWRNLSSLKNVEEQMEALEEELKKLGQSDTSLKNKIEELEAPTTETDYVMSFDEMLEEIKERVEEEREKRVQEREARKNPEAEAEEQNQQEAVEGSSANPKGEDCTTTKVEPPQSEPQARETTPESPQETSATNGPTKESASTTETDNSGTTTPMTTTTSNPATTATTATTTTTITLTTAAAALIEAKKKWLENAASGPMSSTAVLAVLALTVSTVIGMTVV